MAGYEQRVGSTNVFKNRDKSKNPKAPDYKATIEVEVGDQIIELDLAMWQRHSDKAGDYFGMTAKATNVRSKEEAPPQDDSDIPFGR